MIGFKGGALSAGGKRTGLGSSFVGLAAYLEKDPEQLVHFESTLGIDDPGTVARVLQALAGQQNERLEKPVYHFGFSLAPGEQLTVEQWRQVVKHAIQELGAEGHDYFWAIHGDTEHAHVHVALSRSSAAGPAWRPGHDIPALQRVARAAEKAYGLRVVPSSREVARQRGRRGLSDGAFQAARARSEVPFADEIHFHTSKIFRSSRSWKELEDRLAKEGLAFEASSRGYGLLLKDTEGRKTPLFRVHPDLGRRRLEHRLGETWSEYTARYPRRPVLEGEGKIRLPNSLTADQVINRVIAHRQVFTEADLRRELRPLLAGDRVLEEVLSSDRVARIEPLKRDDERGSAEEEEEEPEPLYTTRESMRLEEAALEAVEQLAETQHAPIHAASPEAGLEDAALRSLTSSESGLLLLQGPAGSGKTTLARRLRESAEAAGYQVLGSAPSGKAAQGLGREAEMPARTLASWLRRWDLQTKNDSATDLEKQPTLLVVDEASMLPLSDLKRLAEHANRAGARVLLMGDRHQVPPVGAGQPFPQLLDTYRSARLGTIYRQQHGWMRTASESMGRGAVAAAFDAYEDRGHFEWSTSAEDARASLVLAYWEHQHRHPEESAILLASTNRDVEAMSREIRDEHRRRGELGDGVLVHGRELAVGDRVLFTSNHSRAAFLDDGEAHPVWNGTLGTVLEAAENHLRIQLDGGPAISVDPREYSDLRYAYAVTLHKGQGVTVDRSYVLVTPTMDAPAWTVSATRHRRDVRFFVDHASFEETAEQTHVGALKEALTRDPELDLVQGRKVAEVSGCAIGNPGSREENARKVTAHDCYVAAKDAAQASVRESRELWREVQLRGVFRVAQEPRRVRDLEKELWSAKEHLRELDELAPVRSPV
ncbi:MAG: AAA family ATPase, partial [Holophagales bacterium]|nr:AAA family ATPase [Holophagales bacterium]